MSNPQYYSTGSSVPPRPGQNSQGAPTNSNPQQPLYAQNQTSQAAPQQPLYAQQQPGYGQQHPQQPGYAQYPPYSNQQPMYAPPQQAPPMYQPPPDNRMYATDMKPSPYGAPQGQHQGMQYQPPSHPPPPGVNYSGYPQPTAPPPQQPYPQQPPYNGQPASYGNYPSMPTQQDRLQKLQALAQQYEIKPELVSRLRQLESFEIVLICDDSGSMANPVDSKGQINLNGRPKTRWNELAETATIVTDIASSLDPSGVDIYFLNRAPLRNITTAAQIQDAFRAPPAGYTPIVRTMKTILSEKASVLREKKVLCILCTDGEPTTDQGMVNIPDFKQLLQTKPRNLYMSIVACTDDDSVMRYLNKLDDKVPNLDVVDDFRSEKKEVQKKMGKTFSFTFGDYVAKLMLAPVDYQMDQMDGKKDCRVQ